MKTTFDRSQIPNAQKPRLFNFPKFDRFKLDNGLQVIFARHEKLPILAFQLAVNPGANFDPEGREGIASFVSDMLNETDKVEFTKLITKFSVECFCINKGFQTIGHMSKFAYRGLSKGASKLINVLKKTKVPAPTVTTTSPTLTGVAYSGNL